MDLRKTTSKRKASKALRCNFVLWGELFEEIPATIFTVSLRQVGLCVRVVGVNGLSAVGRNGMLIHADLSLNDIGPLLDQAACLILPCSRAAIKRLENDPRVHALLTRCAQHGAKFVVYDRSVVNQSILHTLAIPRQDIVTYTQVDDLMALGRTVATSLLHKEGLSSHPPSTLLTTAKPHQI
ncbi:MAG: hypothetical protein KF832_27845 [Caldilineaceae bacterium]|nr:hypothetical protein [Caldilineaceae bacterium]